jgi:Tfp pilus assembly protein PilO
MNVKQRWIGGAALLAIVILALGWVTLVSPQRKQVSQYNAQAAAQLQQQDQLRARYALLESEARGETAEQALLAKAQTYIPPSPSEPSLIRQFSQATTTAGVDLQSVTPGSPTAVGTASSTPQLDSVGVTLTVVGGYFQIEQFVSNLENLPRALLVSSVTESPGGTLTGQTAASGTDNLTATITGQAFLTTTSIAGSASGATS